MGLPPNYGIREFASVRPRGTHAGLNAVLPGSASRGEVRPVVGGTPVWGCGAREAKPLRSLQGDMEVRGEGLRVTPVRTPVTAALMSFTRHRKGACMSWLAPQREPALRRLVMSGAA
jgi:hypothetical protein